MFGALDKVRDEFKHQARTAVNLPKPPAIRAQKENMMPVSDPRGPARPSRQAQSCLTFTSYGPDPLKVNRAVRSQTLSPTRKPHIRRDAALWDAFTRPEDFAWSIGDDGHVIVTGGAV